MVKCDICGAELGNLAGLTSHKRFKHGIKKDTVAAEKIIEKNINENKELKQETEKKEDEFVKVNESVSSEFVNVVTNPYKDLYPKEGETTVFNEWC